MNEAGKKSRAVTLPSGNPAAGLGNPASDRRRMWVSLAGLAVIAVLAWVTIDPEAALPVREYSFGSVRFGGFDVSMRWLPELILGLFAFRVVIANQRARLEEAGLEDAGREDSDR